MLRKFSLQSISNWKPVFTSPAILIDSFLPPKNGPIHLMISANQSTEYQRFFTKKIEVTKLLINLNEIEQRPPIQFSDSTQIQEYESKCEKGDLRSIREFCPLLLFGSNGVQRDENKAFKLFERGYKQGDSESTFWYAYCHLNGLGVKTDYHKAISLFKESASKGKLISYLYLYNIFIEGKVVEKNENEALYAVRRFL